MASNEGDQGRGATEGTSPGLFWKNEVFCIISGASRGIGRRIAIEFAKSFHQRHKERGTVDGGAKLSFVLMARDQEALEQLASLLRATGPFVGTTVVIQGTLDEMDTKKDPVQGLEMVISMLGEVKKLDQVILVHNAGSLGNPKQLTNQFSRQDADYLGKYFDLNLNSAIAMTGSFLKWFATVESKVIVNISSLAALKPMKGLSLYCTGKAARDAFFRSVASENEDVRVLSYSPGPVETDMVATLRSDSFVSEFFEDRGNVLSPEVTVARLIEHLELNVYENGAHVDYFDPLQ